ncbi:unnamed protein product [Brassica rapa]|uniref:Uncharacterized protein n=1 Tax=Brassica campestris TaxID=3711 RepID=A0A8D9M4M7_BRACM|nr:unnamed protein product [Brassica rapa]
MNLEQQLKKDAVEEYHVGLRKKEDVGESTTNKRELAKINNIHRHIEIGTRDRIFIDLL